MAIDLNKNGKDDVEEIMEDMKAKLDEAAKDTDAIVAEFVENNIAPAEVALGVDINGDGVIGSAKA